MIDLTGKTILVAGASGLLGRAIALALAEAGARVIPTYKNNIEGAIGPTAWQPSPGAILPPSHLDIVDPTSVQGLAGKVDNIGGLDGLVNCIGINKPNPFDRITPAEFATINMVNLDGSFRLVQALLPHIRDGGSIVLLGSVSASIGGKVSTHYCASKKGLIGLMHNLALFTAPRGIRANCVSPGYVESPLTEAGSESPKVRETIASIPLGRLAQPEDVAGVVAFLMSDNASYITGQNLHVDGGLVLSD